MKKTPLTKRKKIVSFVGVAILVGASFCGQWASKLAVENKRTVLSQNKKITTNHTSSRISTKHEKSDKAVKDNSCVEPQRPAQDFDYRTEYNIVDDYDLFHDPSRDDYLALLERYHHNSTWRCHSNDQSKNSTRNHPPLRLVHVWSPYVASATSQNGTRINTFAPLDHAQNITWESMYRAKEYALQQQQKRRGVLEIQIYCAILWMDVTVIQQIQPPLCTPENTLILNRSSATVWPTLTPPIHYPFVQDLFQPLLLTGNFDNDWDYVILTNSDIALVQPFYLLVATAIEKYGYQVYTANRKTIPKGPTSSDNGETTTRSWKFPELVALETNPTENGTYYFNSHYNKHPGTDCFIIHKNVLSSMTMGDMFVGHPPWARMLKHGFYHYMANTFQTLDSKYGWTYHLGDDRSWLRNTANAAPSHIMESTAGQTGAIRKRPTLPRSVVKRCLFSGPKKIKNPSWHWIQNLMTCASMCNRYEASMTEIIKYFNNSAAMPNTQGNNTTTVALERFVENIQVPPFVLDKERYVSGVLARLGQGVDYHRL